MKSLAQCAAAILFLFAVNNVIAACNFATGDEACDYFFGGLCPVTEWCGYKNCLGKQFGDEAMFVAGGLYPKFWIVQTDETVAEGVGFPCDFTTNHGVSIVEIGDLGHCSMTIASDDHMYIELFASIPETECVAWVECKCF